MAPTLKSQGKSVSLKESEKIRNTAVLGQDQLNRMKEAYLSQAKGTEKENLTGSYGNTSNIKTTNTNSRDHLKLASQEKTKNWSNTVTVKQREQQKQRYLQFEKEELAQRALEKEEDELQRVKNQRIIKAANEKLFQENDKVKAFRSKLLEADVVEERKRQIGFRQYIRELEQEREKDILAQEKELTEKQDARERREAEERRRQLEEHLGVLKHQVDEYHEKQRIWDENERLEGQIIAQAARLEAHQENLEKLREKEKKRAFAQEMIRGNEEIARQKEELARMEAEQDKLIEQYFANRERVLAERKAEEERRRHEKQIARTKVSEDRALELTKIQTRQADDLDRQIAEYQAKVERLEAEHEAKYRARIEQLQKSIQQQVAYKLRLKKEQAEEQRRENVEFQQFWNDKNLEITFNEQTVGAEKTQIAREIAQFNQMLMVR